MDASETTDLKITLGLRARTGFDAPRLCTATWEANMTYCTIHAWMNLFEQVLLTEGFTPREIMDGACQLAFSEHRCEDEMKEVADKYGLTLQMLDLDPSA